LLNLPQPLSREIPLLVTALNSISTISQGRIPSDTSMTLTPLVDESLTDSSFANSPVVFPNVTPERHSADTDDSHPHLVPSDVPLDPPAFDRVITAVSLLTTNDAPTQRVSIPSPLVHDRPASSLPQTVLPDVPSSAETCPPPPARRSKRKRKPTIPDGLLILFDHHASPYLQVNLRLSLSISATTL